MKDFTVRQPLPFKNEPSSLNDPKFYKFDTHKNTQNIHFNMKVAAPFDKIQGRKILSGVSWLASQILPNMLVLQV